MRHRPFPVLHLVISKFANDQARSVFFLTSVHHLLWKLGSGTSEITSETTEFMSEVIFSFKEEKKIFPVNEVAVDLWSNTFAME